MTSGVFDFRSKEERERDYKAFYKRVFPGGEVQKERVRSVLAERLPGEEITFLLMYYITLKDAMVLDDELDFYEAAAQAQRIPCQAALEQAGLACDEGLVRQTNWQFSESFTATTSLLELAERPEAIFCASDWLAIGCYQALAVNGVRIPQDMLLAGYDDQKISEQLTPPLTSIQLPYSELGRLAVEYLCNQEDAATHVTLAGRLKVRASSLV